MAEATDYKFTGYGIISKGSSVKIFEGTDQQLFLGGKNAMTVGVSNTFTVGIKSDVMVGPAVSMSMGPWAWDKPGGFQTGHLTAKYDFSTNKSFVFQIAPEGSSNYLTQAKFNCEEGFLAVAGFQKVGDKVYETYKRVVSGMGAVVALSNLVSSLAIVYKTFPTPEKDAKGEMGKGDLKDDTARQNFAKTSAWAATGTSTGAATAAAIVAAIWREKIFKPWIHPQAVIDLKPKHVFLGAIGDTASAANLSGASLMLKDGRATLGARKYSLITQAPYKEKFNDFELPPTTLLEIDPTSIVCTAENAISIAAGANPGFDPVQTGVVAAKKALRTLEAATAEIAQKAYDSAMLVEGPDPIAQAAAAKAAKDLVEVGAQPAILAAQAAVTAAGVLYKTNPSLYLNAGGAGGGLLSKIEATAPNFNVIAPNMSFATNRTPVARGLFVKTLPTQGIELVQSPTSKISMDMTGSIAMSVNSFVSMNLKLQSIVIKAGPTTSILMNPMGTTIKAGGTKIELSLGSVKVGNSLKVFG